MGLWEKYKETNRIELRNELIVQYFPVVQRVANKMASELPPFIQKEDLESYGVFGLMDAIEKFELDRGLKFETYAVTRIRGAILDELRLQDWAPRSVRAKINSIDKVMNLYESDKGMTELEAAAFVGISAADYYKLKADESVAFVSSLDNNMSEDDPESEMLTLADVLGDQTVDLTSTIEYELIINTIVRRINLLPERERLLMYLYYYEQMTLAEIGKLMQVTESRICQIHTSISSALKDELSRYV